MTDRYSAYNYLPDRNRQLCWAHLKRNFQKISERPGTPGRIGKRLLSAYDKLFRFWKTEYGSDRAFVKHQNKKLRRLKTKLLRHLRDGTLCAHRATARTCSNMWDSLGALWRFFENPGVPPTNNHAERQ